LVDHIEDGDDVRVLERRGELGFLHEPAAALVVGDQAWRQNLERDPTAQTAVQRFIDFAHAAGAQEGDSLVRSKALTSWSVLSPTKTPAFASSNTAELIE
jgi:hypothetical protein